MDHICGQIDQSIEKMFVRLINNENNAALKTLETFMKIKFKKKK